MSHGGVGNAFEDPFQEMSDKLPGSGGRLTTKGETAIHIGGSLKVETEEPSVRGVDGKLPVSAFNVAFQKPHRRA